MTMPLLETKMLHITQVSSHKMFRDFKYPFSNYYRQFTYVHIDVVTYINFIIILQFFIYKVEFVELFFIIIFIHIFSSIFNGCLSWVRQA